VRDFEQRIQTLFKPTPTIQRLLTLPGVGVTLAVVIALEVGDVARFPTAEKLAAYAGTTPRVHASGGTMRFGPARPDVNRYLNWAFVEAGNAICLNRGRAPRRHVSRLYERVARRKGHQKAIGAVARHLAEATYWVLTNDTTIMPRATAKIWLRRNGSMRRAMLTTPAGPETGEVTPGVDVAPRSSSCLLEAAK
jgi:hypothetical protein